MIYASKMLEGVQVIRSTKQIDRSDREYWIAETKDNKFYSRDEIQVGKFYDIEYEPSNGYNWTTYVNELLDHDCHASPEDGCAVCSKKGE